MTAAGYLEQVSGHLARPADTEPAGRPGAPRKLLPAYVFHPELGQESLLPASPLHGFLVRGLATTLVLPLESLHLGRAFRLEGG